MTPATARADDAPLDWKAPVPPAPTTLEETGLGYEALKQLLAKSLFAGELSGPRAGRPALPAVRAPRVAGRTPARREARRSARRRRLGHGGLPLRAHRPRPRPRGDLLRGQRLRRAGARAAQAVRRRDEHAESAARVPRQGAHRARVHAPGRERRDARSARAGRELRQVGVHLRASRQRQDRARRRHRPRARRRHVHPVGARHRRPGHHDLRPGEPREARGRGDRQRPDQGGRPRSPLGAREAPGRDGRRRAHARDARPELQPDREVLRGAAADEGQRRRLRRRRLRPPAHPSARPAEPVDRARSKAASTT